MIYYLPPGKITVTLPMQQYLKLLTYYISVMADKSNTYSSRKACQTMNYNNTYIKSKPFI